MEERVSQDAKAAHDGTTGSAIRDFLRTAWRVVFGAADHLSRDDGWAMASHLALAALMAIFPFLIFVAALAGFIGHAQLASTVTDLVFAAWPEAIAHPISDEVRNVLTVQRGGVLTISIVVTVYLASNGVEAVRTGLNRAYRSVEGRSIFFRRAQSFIFVLIGGVLSLAVAIFGLLGPVLWDLTEHYLPELAVYRSSFFALRYLFLAALLGAGLIVAHLFLPARQPPVRHVWPGIVLTLGLWWAVTRGFTTYVANFTNFGATYAGLAGIVVTIFYLYLISLIMLFGAEFNASLAQQLGEATGAEVTPSEVTMPVKKRRFRWRWRRGRRRSRPSV